MSRPRPKPLRYRERGIKHPPVLSTSTTVATRGRKNPRHPSNRLYYAHGIYRPCELRSKGSPTTLQKSPRRPSCAGTCSTALSCTTCTTLRLTRTRTSLRRCLQIVSASHRRVLLGKEVFKKRLAHCRSMDGDFCPQWKSLNAAPNITESRPLDWLGRLRDQD